MDNEEDDYKYVEGFVESPNARQKIFSSTEALGQFIALIRPTVCQVQPTNDGRHVLTWQVEL